MTLKLFSPPVKMNARIMTDRAVVATACDTGKTDCSSAAPAMNCAMIESSVPSDEPTSVRSAVGAP